MKAGSKKIALILAAIGLLTQIPFAYHRYRIGKLSDRIAALSATGHASDDERFEDFPGVIHVHTSLGGHSTATIEDLLKGAKGLSFVVSTEHIASNFDTSALTLNGVHNGTLFVGGHELSTGSGDRLLLVPGSEDAAELRTESTPSFLKTFHKRGRLAFVAYPETFTSWDSKFDGVEIFSLNESVSALNKVRLALEIIWAYHKYPELTLAIRFSRPDFNLQKYDEVASQRRITLFVGSDAHSNIGFHLLGDDAGNKILRIKFDDYATIFKIAKTHVLLDKYTELTRESLLDALRQGHDYVSMDILSDPKGFSFIAGDKSMGDEIKFEKSPVLKVKTPRPSRIVVFRNGTKVSETSNTTEATFEPEECGAYRVEVFLDSLGAPFDQMPWIISNPIYVIP
jgi:hypothetical protein